VRRSWRAVLLVGAGGLALTACNVPERLSQVGREPDLRPIVNPVEQPGYRPVSLPMPPPEPRVAAGANSLWRSGARGFFRDQRARRVGDVLTVQVTIDDRAELSNETSRSRQASDGLGIPSFFGFESRLADILPNAVNPASLVEAESDMAHGGRGAVDREEEIELAMAAIITQVLPNGNLVVEGRQDVRVNFEVREIYVAGIVRPEDISPANTISHEKMAELRFAYGGRGQITDVQQPRYGAQVLDIILPY
jgi:flagellar L-ring protein FlgH